MTKCLSGEACGGTRHQKDDETGRWEKCSCYFRSAQLRRLKSAGIPEAYADLKAEEAVFQSNYAYELQAVPDVGGFIRSVATWLLEGPTECLTLPSKGGANTFPLGAYFAAQAALAIDVLQANGLWFVSQEFENKNAVAIGCRAPFLLLWGMGGDTAHAWLGPLLYRILYDRCQNRRPTVVAFAPDGAVSGGVYGATLAAFLAAQHPLRGA